MPIALIHSKQSITVIDNRTGKSFELPITHDTIKASDLGKIKGDGFAGLRSYDPAYFNTACVTSRISFIDGDKGILNYRGYPIEQLAEKSSFLEVSYLLIYGELPDKVRIDGLLLCIMCNVRGSFLRCVSICHAGVVHPLPASHRVN